ncbi:MAG: hypothetical protein RMJ67_09845 [Elusimicrobiota bacterium]|nr:hypothetical protein [Endomicrobiia bacterium]MDW8166798.1 hypothetical protein [Elusimicrobiota bacterium]
MKDRFVIINHNAHNYAKASKKVKSQIFTELSLILEEFICTLTATDISTGWTELRAIKNKAMVCTVAALEDIVLRGFIQIMALSL